VSASGHHSPRVMARFCSLPSCCFLPLKSLLSRQVKKSYPFLPTYVVPEPTALFFNFLRRVVALRLSFDLGIIQRALGLPPPISHANARFWLSLPYHFPADLSQFSSLLRCLPPLFGIPSLFSKAADRSFTFPLLPAAFKFPI